MHANLTKVDPDNHKACPRFAWRSNNQCIHIRFQVLNNHCQEHVNDITCNQVSRKETSINLNTLVNRSIGTCSHVHVYINRYSLHFIFFKV